MKNEVLFAITKEDLQLEVKVKIGGELTEDDILIV